MTQEQPVSNSNCRITSTSCLLNHRCSFQISRAYYLTAGKRGFLNVTVHRYPICGPPFFYFFYIDLGLSFWSCLKLFNTVYNENVPQKWWIKKKGGGGSTKRVPMSLSKEMSTDSKACTSGKVSMDLKWGTWIIIS